MGPLGIALAERLHRWRADGDVAAVREGKVLAEVSVLVRLEPEDEESIRIAGETLLARHAASGQSAPAEFAAAVVVYGGMARSGRAVPADIRIALAEMPASAWASGAVLWAAEAADRLGPAMRHDDADGLARGIELLYLADIVSAPAVVRPAWASNLAAALSMQYEMHRRMHSWQIEEAVRFAEMAIVATSPGDPDYPVYLSTAAIVRNRRFNGLRDPSDLDAAITAGREAVRVAASGSPLRTRVLTNLSMSLTDRYELSGSTADLDEALRHATDAVTASTSPGERILVLSNLGLVANEHAQRTGDLASLAVAIGALDEAVSQAPADDPRRLRCLTNLSTALQARFELLGAAADIDRAVEAARLSAAATPPRYHEAATRWTNLSNALRSRYLRHQHLDDLDEAVAAAERAVQAGHAPGARRAIYLSNLGTTLLTRFEARTAAAGGASPDEAAARDLTAALAAHADAAAAAAAAGDTVVHAATLHNLARAYAIAYRSGRPGDLLARAIEYSREAVERTPAGHPDRSRYLNEYASHLRLSSDPADQARAISSLTEAASAATSPAAPRVRAARQFADLAAARADWPAAAQILEPAVSLLPRVAWQGLDRADRDFYLARWTGLGSDAAAAWLQAGDPRRAVELVEQGRAVQHSQLLDHRADLSRLAAVDDGLARRLAAAARALDSA